MFSYIHMLPPEVVGQHVLAFLSLKHLAHLDNAIINHKYRAEFLELLTYCPPIAINDAFKRIKLGLLWFKHKKCRIKEIKLSLSQPECFDIDTSMVDRVVLHIDQRLIPSDIDKLSQSLVAYSINNVTVFNQQDNAIMYSLFKLLHNVKELTVHYYGRAEKPFAWLESTLNAGVLLSEFTCGFSELTYDIMNFIFQQGHNLTSLNLVSLHVWEIDPNEFLKELGCACSRLEILTLNNWSEKYKPVCQDGFIALVRSCRSLQTIEITALVLTDLTMIAIAQHCPHLRILVLCSDSAVQLTYVALTALSKQYLPREKLEIPWIPIPSAEVTAECAHALSRIHSFKPTPALASNVPSLYVCYLRSLHNLDLQEGLSERGTLEVLTAITAHCRQVHTIIVCGSTQAILQQLTALASTNPSLARINMHKATALTDTVLVELIKQCPRLTKIYIHHSHLLTHTGIIALSMRLPGITSVHLNDCTRLTNACILALSEHCKYLEFFTIKQCDQLTEAALIPLVQFCRHLQYLRVSPSNMSEETKSLLLAQRSAQPSRYADLTLLIFE